MSGSLVGIQIPSMMTVSKSSKPSVSACLLPTKLCFEIVEKRDMYGKGTYSLIYVKKTIQFIHVRNQ